MEILIVFRELLIAKTYLDEFIKIFVFLANFVIVKLNY